VKLFLGFLVVSFLLGMFLRLKRKFQFLFLFAVCLFVAFGYFFLNQI